MSAPDRNVVPRPEDGHARWSTHSTARKRSLPGQARSGCRSIADLPQIRQIARFLAARGGLCAPSHDAGTGFLRIRHGVSSAIGQGLDAVIWRLSIAGLPRRPRSPIFRVGRLLAALAYLASFPSVAVEEYELKALFLVNFIRFTEWPAPVGGTLNLCVYGENPFGRELGKLKGTKADDRLLEVRDIVSSSDLDDCHVVFISQGVIGNLGRVLDYVGGKPVLLVADSPGAARQGVALNMGTVGGRVTFEANLAAARENGLNLSSKLLRLATEVIQ